MMSKLKIYNEKYIMICPVQPINLSPSHSPSPIVQQQIKSSSFSLMIQSSVQVTQPLLKSCKLFSTYATSAFVIQSTSTPTSAAKPTPTSTYTIPRTLAKMSSTLIKSQTIQDPQVALVNGPDQGRRCLDLGPA